jgi:hypothetical protein
MNQKRLLITFCILVLAASTLAIGRRNQSVQPVQPAPTPVIPDLIAYRHLFRHAAAFKKQAEEADKLGKNSASYRAFFKNKADLNEAQARTLDDISSQCDQEIHALDMKAKAIVSAIRAQYPKGQLPHGQRPPAPPTELKSLREARDAIVGRACERLQAAFGDAEFRRFDDYVKHQVAPNIQQVSASQVSPASPIDGQ